MKNLRSFLLIATLISFQNVSFRAAAPVPAPFPMVRVAPVVRAADLARVAAPVPVVNPVAAFDNPVGAARAAAPAGRPNVGVAARAFVPATRDDDEEKSKYRIANIFFPSGLAFILLVLMPHLPTEARIGGMAAVGLYSASRLFWSNKTSFFRSIANTGLVALAGAAFGYGISSYSAGSSFSNLNPSKLFGPKSLNFSDWSSSSLVTAKK